VTPTTLETLFKMKREKISLDGDIWALNARLRLEPWHQPAVMIWVMRARPDGVMVGPWNEVLAMLDLLYEEFLQKEETKDE
jgi:hypothetical protein